MPKNTQIKSILMIGAGPIQIGQAGEFDYSGTQGLNALAKEGYRMILVNSNPATLMTDPELAYATYIEPLTLPYLTAIIQKEKPDAFIATFGGQTALNCALALHENGILAEYQIKLLGASIEAIRLAEDRTLFQHKMRSIGVDVPSLKVAYHLEEAMEKMKELGLPFLVRSSYSLGGQGARIIEKKTEALQLFKQFFAVKKHASLMLTECMSGWKEFELEVVRDSKNNCIVVCGVENINPLGVHTGDSITVAPIQTLTDKQYQAMRDAAFKIVRAIGVETGGCNIQFAVHPKTGRMVVIEMNPRVSRSSALVSKATAYPIAKIAAKLAVGYTMDELKNDITLNVLPASFEPSIDYVVVKIPRFQHEKFDAQRLPLGPEMRSVGEVMGIGSTFAEGLQQALCSLDMGVCGLDSLNIHSHTKLKFLLSQHTYQHLWVIAESYRQGILHDEIQSLASIDSWFLYQIKELVRLEQTLIEKELTDLNRESLTQLKKNGFSDQRIAELVTTDETQVRKLRQALGVVPVFRCIDSCAGEFEASTSYIYSTYQTSCEVKASLKSKVIIIGSGPNRIGQGIEFDYLCIKAANAFMRAGFEAIILNCNPGTVSTDYNAASRLYFTPLTFEKVMDIIEKEKPSGVALQFGGQTPFHLLDRLEQAGVALMGADANSVRITEDRERFRHLIQTLGFRQAKNLIVNKQNVSHIRFDSLKYPVMIRPSFVLGGGHMEVIFNKAALLRKLKKVSQNTKYPILVEEFLTDAIELDVDVICDGKDVLIPAILEQIEAAGVHSGDSACITPPCRLSPKVIQSIHKQTQQLAIALGLKGLMNVQFAIKDSMIFVIEINLRASRTLPFVCKSTGFPLVESAVQCMLGHSLGQLGYPNDYSQRHYCVKEVVFPFDKFPKYSPKLGPEMKSTGEVMGIGATPAEAFLKAQISSGNFVINTHDIITVFIANMNLQKQLMPLLISSRFKVIHKLSAQNLPDIILSTHQHVKHLQFAIQHHILYTSTLEAASMLLKSIIETVHTTISVQSLQQYFTGLI